MKKYVNIGGFRLLNIKVIYNDTEVLYEGKAEDTPSDIKGLKYSKIQIGNPTIAYVYN